MTFYKVLLVGDSATGKTSLAHRIVQDTFSESYKATIGCEFALKIIELAGIPHRVQLWDLAGQDRISAISRVYCRDAAGVVVVCDLSREESVGRVKAWKACVEEQTKNIPMVLCCNKTDLMRGNWDTLHSRCEQLSEEAGFRGVFFCSAKTGESVNEALLHLITEIWSAQAQASPQEETHSVKLGSSAGKDGFCKC